MALTKHKLSLPFFDPILNQSSRLHSTLVHKRDAHEAPAIFITPVLGGFDVLEKILARKLAKAGYAVFITSFMPRSSFASQVADLNVHDKAYLKSLAGLKTLMDYADTLPFIATGQYGLFGMSLGGIFTTLNTTSNPRVKASVIIAGAGDSVGVITQSQHKIMLLLKAWRKKYFRFTSRTQYQELLKQHLFLDAQQLRSKETPPSMMVISLADSLVPTPLQLKVWKQFAPRTTIFSQRGHLQMIALAPWAYFKKILNHFDQHLKKQGKIEASL